MTSPISKRQINHHATDHSRRYRAPSREAFHKSILACWPSMAGEGRSGPVSSRPTGFLSFTTKRSIPTSTIDSVPSQAVGRRQCLAAFPVSRGETPAHHSIAMTISASINPALVPNVIAKTQSIVGG